MELDISERAAAATLSDETLVARVVAGERHLFELLVRRHNQRLFRVCRAMARSDADAEDAVQAAYLAAYQHLGQFAGAARFSTWLTRIAIHETLARVRSAGRRREEPMQDDDQPGGGESPEEAASHRQLTALLEQSIDALPEPYRLVLVMRDVQQLSTAEAAACLDVSEENVKVRLHRARAMLRDRMTSRLDRLVPEAFHFMGERCDRMVARVMAAIAPA